MFDILDADLLERHWDDPECRPYTLYVYNKKVPCWVHRLSAFRMRSLSLMNRYVTTVPF